MTASEEPDKTWNVPNMQPTMNGTGFMFKVLDEFANEFIEFAGQTDGEVLDIGCAYGVASIPALEGGGRVTACDLDPRHLEILTENTPPAARERLTTMTGQLPAIDLPQNRFSAILCSRVLHFLDGSAVDASVRNMFQWLKPGGHLYLVADTPYGIWRKQIPVFEARRKRGDRWPGLMIGLENYLPYPPKDRSIDGPPFMNLLDTELLERTCREAGFEVVRSSFIDRQDFRGLGRMDGRENVGIHAVKPG